MNNSNANNQSITNQQIKLTHIPATVLSRSIKRIPETAQPKQIYTEKSCGGWIQSSYLTDKTNSQPNRSLEQQKGRGGGRIRRTKSPAVEMGTGRCGAERCRRSRRREQKGGGGSGTTRRRARTSHHQNTRSCGEAELQIAMAISLSLDSIRGCVF